MAQNLGNLEMKFTFYIVYVNLNMKTISKVFPD